MAHAAQREGARRRRAGGRSRAARDGDRRVEQRGDAAGRGARAGQARHDVGAQRERAGEIAGQADGGDELAEADRPVGDEPAADQRDEREERAGQQDPDAGDRGIRVGRAQRGVQRAAARAAVALDRGPLGADPLEHAQPGDEVGGDAGRARRLGLLAGRALDERPAEQLDEHEQRRQAGEHERTEQERDPQQRRRRDGDPGDGRQAHADHERDLADARGVGRRDAQQPARQPSLGRAAARVQDAPRQREAQLVSRGLGGPLELAVAEAVGERQHRERRGEQPEPQGQRGLVAGDDRAVDRRADHRPAPSPRPPGGRSAAPSRARRGGAGPETAPRRTVRRVTAHRSRDAAARRA